MSAPVILISDYHTCSIHAVRKQGKHYKEAMTAIIESYKARAFWFTRND